MPLHAGADNATAGDRTAGSFFRHVAGLTSFEAWPRHRIRGRQPFVIRILPLRAVCRVGILMTACTQQRLLKKWAEDVAHDAVIDIWQCAKDLKRRGRIIGEIIISFAEYRACRM